MTDIVLSLLSSAIIIIGIVTVSRHFQNERAEKEALEKKIDLYLVHRALAENLDEQHFWNRLLCEADFEYMVRYGVYYKGERYE